MFESVNITTGGRINMILVARQAVYIRTESVTHSHQSQIARLVQKQDYFFRYGFTSIAAQTYLINMQCFSDRCDYVSLLVLLVVAYDTWHLVTVDAECTVTAKYLRVSLLIHYFQSQNTNSVFLYF
jgi:hypothetical protein